MAKKKKLSKSDKIKLLIEIFLIIVIGVCFGLSVMCGVSKEWIWFAVYLAVAIVLSAVEIPLFYHGTTYECPKCGQQFKANPYKVFFTNGILGIADLDGSGSKYAKLKCPDCKTKEWCKKHYH